MYHVEANQIHGPSFATTFDPRTATLSATYPKTPGIVVSPAPPRRPPRSPHFATERQENLAKEIVKGWPKPPKTAPVNNVNPYPFPGYSPVSYTLRHLIVGDRSSEMIVFRRRLHSSHAPHLQAGFLGRCIQDSLCKGMELEKSTENGSKGEAPGSLQRDGHLGKVCGMY